MSLSTITRLVRFCFEHTYWIDLRHGNTAKDDKKKRNHANDRHD
jgi:hypothetical protein